MHFTWVGLALAHALGFKQVAASRSLLVARSCGIFTGLPLPPKDQPWYLTQHVAQVSLTDRHNREQEPLKPLKVSTPQWPPAQWAL